MSRNISIGYLEFFLTSSECLKLNYPVCNAIGCRTIHYCSNVLKSIFLKILQAFLHWMTDHYPWLQILEYQIWRYIWIILDFFCISYILLDALKLLILKSPQVFKLIAKDNTTETDFNYWHEEFQLDWNQENCRI